MSQWLLLIWGSDSNLLTMEEKTAGSDLPFGPCFRCNLLFEPVLWDGTGMYKYSSSFFTFLRFISRLSLTKCVSSCTLVFTGI